MSFISDPVLSRRDRWLLGSVMVAPGLAYLVVRLFGLTSHLKLAALGVTGLLGATVCYLRPREGMWFVVFYIYAGLGFYFPLNVAGLVTVVALAAVLIDLLRGDANRLTDPLFLYANAVFLLIAVGSMIVARDPAHSLGEVVEYLKVLVLVFLLVQLVRTPAQLRTLMYVIFAGSVAAVVLGVMNLVFGIQSIGENYIHTSEYVIRFIGTQENPNRAAAYMCTAVPLGMFAVKHAPRALKPFWILGIVILVGGVYATFSRSAAFPLAMMTGAVLLREVRSRRSFFIVATLIAVAAILTPHVWWERVLGLEAAFETTTLDWSVYNRLLALHTAWELFLRYPLTGVGIGNFIDAASYQVFMRIVVHNTYLEILVGTGLFGLTAFLLIMSSGFRHTVTGVRARWNGQPEWMRSACFYCALSAVSMWMSSFFGTMSFRQPFWIPIATGLIIANLARTGQPAGPSASA